MSLLCDPNNQFQLRQHRSGEGTFFLFPHNSSKVYYDMVQVWKWVVFPFKYNFEAFYLLEYFQYFFYPTTSQKQILHFYSTKNKLLSYFVDVDYIIKHTVHYPLQPHISAFGQKPAKSKMFIYQEINKKKALFTTYYFLNQHRDVKGVQ